MSRPKTPRSGVETPAAGPGAFHPTEAAFWTAFVVLFGVALALIHLL